MDCLLEALNDCQSGTILTDPPWRFANRTGKVGPERKRLHRYQTMSLEEIAALPVRHILLARGRRCMSCPGLALGEALATKKGCTFAHRRRSLLPHKALHGGARIRGSYLKQAGRDCGGIIPARP